MTSDKPQLTQRIFAHDLANTRAAGSKIVKPEGGTRTAASKRKISVRLSWTTSDYWPHSTPRPAATASLSSTASLLSIHLAPLNSGDSLTYLRRLFVKPATLFVRPPSGTKALPSWHRPRPLSRKTTKTQTVFAALATAVIVIPTATFATPLTVSEFGQLALRCGPSVAPSTLASVARTESAFEPLSINDNNTGKSDVPVNRDIAIQIASNLLESGHSIDIGIMQINSGNFARLGLTLQRAFDPCLSVAAGAAILTGDYAGGETHEEQQSALRVALSRYNTGDAQRGFENGYVHKVELAAGHIVPALDVGAAPAAIDSQHIAAAAPSAPVDPNAPPSWDVWSSFDYAATNHQTMHIPASSGAARSSGVPGSALLADTGQGPTAAVAVSGPVIER